MFSCELKKKNDWLTKRKKIQQQTNKWGIYAFISCFTHVSILLVKTDQFSFKYWEMHCALCNDSSVGYQLLRECGTRCLMIEIGHCNLAPLTRVTIVLSKTSTFWCHRKLMKIFVVVVVKACVRDNWITSWNCFADLFEV